MLVLRPDDRPLTKGGVMSTSLLGISFDCADATQTAGFWSRLLDRTIDDGASTEFASIGLGTGGADGTIWMFHRVPESKTAKNRVHVDLVAESLEKSVAQALEYGAARLGDFDEGGFQWTTLSDPEGNEFDIVAAPH
jgi:hypothetical protein